MLIPPILKGLLVELCAIKLPLWKKLVHQGAEAFVVTAFEQVDHLVNHDIFQTGQGFFGQFQV